MTSATQRLPNVILFGIGNNIPALSHTRHNIGTLIMQKYLSELDGRGWQKGMTGKNSWMYQGVKYNEALMTAFRERMAQRLRRKHQAEQGGMQKGKQQTPPSDALPNDELERLLEEKIAQFCPQPLVNLHIMLPSTPMNLSGNALRSYCDTQRISYKSKRDRILIVYDDLDLQFGSFKMKYKTGDAGHNGIKDIERKLGTDKFYRLKVGIQPHGGTTQSGRDFVLSRFSKPDLDVIEGKLYEQIREVCLEGFPHLDVNDVMTRTNTL